MKTTQMTHDKKKPIGLLLVGLLLVGFVLPGLTFAPEAEAATTTSRVLEITDASANPTVPFKKFDGNPPKVFDINGDGKKEIIVQNDNHWVYVFDSETGEILAEVRTTLPSGWGARTFNGPEVAVLQEGGDVRLIAANSAAYVTSFRFDPSSSSPTNFVLKKEWEVRLNQCHSDPGMDAKVTLADLTGDGRMEIIAPTEEQGVYALRADGSILWKNCVGGGNAAANVADLNRDGRLDVIHVNDGGLVVALKGDTGGWMWGYDVSANFDVGSGSIPVMAGIGQLDGKGGPDVVVGVRDAPKKSEWQAVEDSCPNTSCYDWSKHNARLVAIDSGGGLLWHARDTSGNPLTYTRPVVVDADNNGVNEVYWGDWNTVGHSPPTDDHPDAWKQTGPANFYRYSNSGNLVWKQTLGTWWSNKDVPIADVDGDGVQEMLANGPSGGKDGIWYLNSKTGAKETWVSLYPYKAMRAPVVADLYGKGTMQWVVQVEGAVAGAAKNAVLVYDTHAPYRAAWPHVPYPVPGEKPPQPEPGDFDASFSGVKGNEWWIQAQVSASGGTLSKVDVRLDGGSWKPLKNEGWGWAASYHAPQGTIIQLRATSTGGATDLSGCYRWTDATSTSCPSPEAPPQGEFDAAYSGVKGNEWWIQTQVSTTGGTLSKVDVSLNGGSWKPLNDEGWGWAASYHAPEGTIIQLRATSTGGATDLSGCYKWTGATTTTCPSNTAMSFTPKAQGNDWWVEVAVSGSNPIQKVDARINGGSWNNLPPTDWGTWAKSIHAPDGSSVMFRATDSTGATGTSQTYIWD